ncbi:MAG: cupin domain-containing protein [Pseudomonadota bacterium]
MSNTLGKAPIDLASRIVRYKDLRPCFDAFIDTRTPGSNRKENFTIIGPGVSENPAQHVHIAEAHGFNIGGARQPPGCTNSQHSHETAEVFYVHSGTWRFQLGEHGEDACATLSPGDLISIPTHLFRGFTNIGDTDGFLWAILGGDDPGRVLWAPKVFELAERYGLVLLENGCLVDTAKGEALPAHARPIRATTEAQVNALQRFCDAQLEACICRSSGRRSAAQDGGAFHGVPGVCETRLIGEGGLDWAHGFVASEVSLAPGAAIPRHQIDARDVWFVQSGILDVDVAGTKTRCAPGDTLTVPCGAERAFFNRESNPATMVAVRSGDQAPNIIWS